jgi:serine phosphatase RsbU (regulator of sigma subunit)
MLPDLLSSHHRSQDLSKSRAVREASLRSEVHRAYAVIGVILLIVVVVLLPEARRGDLLPHVRIASVIGIGILLAVQLGVLLLARWAQRHDRMVPSTLVVLTVVVESLIPSGMIFSHTVTGGLPPFTALCAPPVLAFGMMLTLTTLRLRPALCLLAGTVSALSYAGVLAYAIYGMGVRETNTGLPLVAYVNFALIIFISALAAAWVAREIRGHMEAALGEAETRRQMERMEQDLEVARSIQRALLPRAAPAIAGFEIAGWNRPADQTGGDYYDWQELPDKNWIVTLADVSGHGIGPALVTAACRAYVRASGAHHGDLGSLTARVNQLLAEDLPGGRFVTMVSVLINPRGGPLALLSAGHGPIVLYVGKSGAVQDILPQDLPLAIEPDMRFGPAQSISLEHGDVLALVTDGYTEWARAGETGRGEEFGVARLRESLGRHAHLPASSMIEAITADVTRFTAPTRQQDDLTMVIIRRVAPQRSQA